MEKMKKRIAVIGAGASGIGSIKSLRDENLVVVCFERTGNFGGLWRYREDDMEGVGSVMENTFANTSKELTACSLLPFPSHFPNYVHHSLMLKYITMMAESFGVLDAIRYHHLVTSVEPAENYEKTGEWAVTTEHTKTKHKDTEIFDGVMVCTGHHVFPNIPEYEGQKRFKGKIIHTRHLKNSKAFQNQKVCIVGTGSSGLDSAAELSNVSSKTYLSSRRGFWIFPRLGPRGYPIDVVFLRRFLMVIKKCLPHRLVCSITEWYLNERFNHYLYNLNPKHRILSQHPSVNDVIPIKIILGVVTPKSAVKKFTEKGVIFVNEQEETEVDTVVFATGYKIKFPFLSDDILPIENNRVKLYKFIYPPHLPHATLAFLGLVQPSGPGIPVGELQCRWSSRVMSGKCKLPSKDEMYKDIREKEDFNRKWYVDSSRHTLEADFIDYQDELADLIRAKPNFLKLFCTDPKLWWALATGPSLAAQYRLQGPGVWNGARDVILTYKQRVLAPLNSSYNIDKSNRTHGIFWLMIITLIGLIIFRNIVNCFCSVS